MNINEVNWKQWDSVEASDSVALVTGARIKIGYHFGCINQCLITLFVDFLRYQIALRLLRSGMTVIAVTRFPNVAAMRYMCESDFEVWKNKLRILVCRSRRHNIQESYLME